MNFWNSKTTQPFAGARLKALFDRMHPTDSLLLSGGPTLYDWAAETQFSAYPKKEKIIIGDPDLIPAILAGGEHYPEERSKFHFLSQRERTVESSWNDTPWGQSIDDLPPFFAEIARALFPEYPKSRAIRFKMLEDILASAYLKLDEMGIKHVEGPLIRLEEKPSGLFAFYQNEKMPRLITAQNDYMVINLSRQVICPPHVIVTPKNYQAVFSKAKSYWFNQTMVFLGSERVLDWILRDIPQIKLYHLILPHESERFDLQKKRKGAFYFDKVSFSALENGQLKMTGKSLDDDTERTIIVPKAHLFLATASQPNPTITAGIPPSRCVQASFASQETSPKLNTKQTISKGGPLTSMLNLQLLSQVSLPAQTMTSLRTRLWEQALFDQALNASWKTASSLLQLIEQTLNQLTGVSGLGEQHVLQAISKEYQPHWVEDKHGDEVVWQVFRDTMEHYFHEHCLQIDENESVQLKR